MESTEYDILSIEQGYTDDKGRDDSSDSKRIHFLIRSDDSLAVLPDCRSGSTAKNVIYLANPSDPNAIIHVKDLDGDWYPGASGGPT